MFIFYFSLPGYPSLPCNLKRQLFKFKNIQDLTLCNDCSHFGTGPKEVIIIGWNLVTKLV